MAYTSLALGAHTDTNYFTDPARLQMFHLLSHTDGDGGASLLVDGLMAANILQQKFPEAFKVLSNYGIMYHANGNDDVSLRTEQCYPVLSLGKSSKIHQVRWNNDDRAALPIRYDNNKAADVWYDAARKWVEIIRSPECEYWEQLKPGRPLSTSLREICNG
jgi:trimethyllysine dioxygenase